METESCKRERPYRAKHIRKCFPLASDPVVSRWIERGFLSHGTVRRGTLTLNTFSLSEIVHTGILAEISAHGITRVPDNVMIEIKRNGPDMTDITHHPLKDSYEITRYYEDIRYDACLIFVSLETMTTVRTNRHYWRDGQIYTPKTRHKQAVRTYIGQLRRPHEVSGIINQAVFHPEEYHMDRAIVIIHVGSIANRVCAALGLDTAWQASMPAL